MTPNEFRSVHIPYRHIQPTDISQLKEMFVQSKPLDEIIDFVNSKTLALDLRIDEIVQLNSIRKRLIKRRK